MSESITNEQTIELIVEGRTAKGRKGPIDADPVWSSSDINIETVTPTAEHAHALVTGINTGVGVISVAAKANGVDLPVATDEITVTQAPVVSAVIVEGPKGEQ